MTDEPNKSLSMSVEETAALAAMLYVRMAAHDPKRPESRHVDFEFPLDEWRLLFDRALNTALGFQDRESLQDRVCTVTNWLMSKNDELYP